MAKYYSIDDALKMLPYVKAFSKDLKRYFRTIESLTRKARQLSSLTSMDKTKQAKILRLRKLIREKIETWNARVNRWELELKELHITICDVPSGRLNVPVYMPWIEAMVLFCVMPETTEFNVEWHFENETYEEARPYFEHVT